MSTMIKGGWLVFVAMVSFAGLAAILCAIMDSTEPVRTDNAIWSKAHSPNLVTTIRPRHSPTHVFRVKQPTSIKPYYEADLTSQVSGPVKYITKNIGDRVTRGELLIEVDVPNEVPYRKALLAQRIMERKQAEVEVKVALTSEELAWSQLVEQEALLRSAEATRDLRQTEWKQISNNPLRKEEALESWETYMEAEATLSSVRNSLSLARAAWNEKKAACESGESQVLSSQANIDRAREEWKRAKALVSSARIRAPFDGVVTSRGVDPGCFVQTTMAGKPSPLISIQRTDIVTAIASLADHYAPFVSTDTEVVIELDALPHRQLRGRVTRSTVTSQDRALHVEVDLFNGTLNEYRRLIAGQVVASLVPFGSSRPVEAPGLFVASHLINLEKLKEGPSPVPAFPTDTANPPFRLFPGMSGTMTVLLRGSRDLAGKEEIRDGDGVRTTPTAKDGR